MKRKSVSKKIWGFSACALLLSACSTGKMIEINPKNIKLTPDSSRQVSLNVDIDVPSHYFSRRSRLIIVPQLMNQTQVEDIYDPLVLDASIYAKKKRRKEVLDGWEDPYKAFSTPVKNSRRGVRVPYSKTILLSEGSQNGKQIWGVVTTDGCGECTAMDTVLLATIADPVELIRKESLKLNWIEPEFVIRPKIREGRGVANLQFIINRYDIRLDLGNNRSEMEDMLQTLKPIIEDSLAELKSVHIDGLASADGPLSFNTPLARNRANSAKEWLQSRLALTPEQKRVFTSSSRPEGWGPVLQAMYQAGDADSVAVKNILLKYAAYNDDVQEKYIRRLSCWPNIRKNYLQKDRKVAYVYTYAIKSFTTDEELLAMYEKRPDAFNEEELLRVSTLKKGLSEKIGVYRTILHYFPQSQIAANNLAILLMREGKETEAEQVLHSVDSLSDYALNTLAATYVYQNKYEQAVELLQVKGKELPEAKYNLGIVRAMQRRLDESYELLKSYNDVNTAILALSVNANEDADRMMRLVAEQDPLHEYVRAMIAARLKRHSDFYLHLEHAVTDASLKEKAAVEYDFMPYHEEKGWKDLMEN